MLSFGKGIKLEVISNGKAKRKLSNGKYDEGEDKNGEGYVYYKPDSEKLFMLFIKKTSVKYIIINKLLQVNKNELRIKRKNKNYEEKVNLNIEDVSPLESNDTNG